MLYGSGTWSAKEESVIRVERNDARMVRFMCNVRPDDRISAEEHRTRLKLSSMRGFLQNIYRIEDYNDLIIQEEWKRVHGLVDEEPSRLVVVSLKDDLGKSEIR